MKYFIVENNQPAGPFEIEELVRKGIKADDLVWCEGMEQWTSASNISEIMAALNRCPGIPPETLWQTGRYEDAEKTSGKAKKWTLIAFLSGFAFYALYLISMFTVFSNLKF